MIGNWVGLAFVSMVCWRAAVVLVRNLTASSGVEAIWKGPSDMIQIEGRGTNWWLLGVHPEFFGLPS